ncbi:MAG: hypothetical protein VXW87_01615, partial [Pseudomonadota bacterium]|nr:hypothetical protein [Pseudomonadota bacterium]
MSNTELSAQFLLSGHEHHNTIIGGYWLREDTGSSLSGVPVLGVRDAKPYYYMKSPHFGRESWNIQVTKFFEGDINYQRLLGRHAETSFLSILNEQINRDTSFKELERLIRSTFSNTETL